MKKISVGILALSLTLPLGVQAQTGDRMTSEQLIQYAVDQNLCDDRSVVSADYLSEQDNRIGVTCGDPAAAATSSASGLSGPGVAGAAALAGLGIVALAAGGSSSSSDTQ